MLLHVTLAALPGSPLRTNSEIVIDAGSAPSGSTICHELTDRYGAARYTIGGTPLEDLTPGSPPFVNGAVILCGPPDSGVPPKVPADVSVPLLFVVSAGPDAGLVMPLKRGTYIVGRGSMGDAADGQRLRISDPALSRCHARIEVGTDAIVLHDLRSANGTWLDGRRVRSAVINTGSVLLLGKSTCRLAVPVRDAAVLRHLPEQDGRGFSDPLTVALPATGPGGFLLLAGALLPLILGVVLAMVSGMWVFLAFSSLSAVMAFLSLASARRRRRAQTKSVAHAADADAARRHAAAPSPGSIVLRSAGKENVYSLPPPGYGWYPIRIGAADQPANIQPVPARERFTPPVLAAVPVVLRLGQEEDISIAGADAASLARTVLLQAASAAGCGARMVIVCAGSPGDLEVNARFLPGVVLLPLPQPDTESPKTPAEAASLMSSVPVLQGETPQVVVLAVYGAWAGCGELLAAALPKVPGRRTTILRIAAAKAPTHVEAAAGRATLRTVSASLPFQPDNVGVEAFGTLARVLAGEAAARSAAAGADAPGALPPAAAFADLHRPDPHSIQQAWHRHPSGRPAAVGLTVSGPLALDLESDGPHFLVAGTTGSGKSEFLRTFLLGLALAYPPNALNMLLIDFKGGSGLGPLTALPHSVGLLTDLSPENVSRALVSLRAEVSRREALFAPSGADNLAQYNLAKCNSADSPHLDPLPRLVAVIDEFRMLSDAVPTAVPELLRIAAVGRSLGIHLVLATQRPQGAVTADIRANITTSIALRVQSAAESRDVMGSDSAADIRPGEPGRGYLRKGNDRPVAFQGLSTTLAEAPVAGTVQELGEYLSGAAGARRPVNSRSELQRICSLIRDAAAAGGFPALFRPVQQPLPHVLDRRSVTRLSSGNAGTDRLVLGILDRPELQRLEPLAWSPATDSHLAVLGAGGSGSSETLDLLAAEHLRCLPARHLYVLDASGQLDWTAAAPQTGAYVGPNDTKRGARVLAYLADALVARLSSGQDLPRSGCPGPHPPVTLVVAGWGRWCSAFRQERNPAPEDDLADLVRDGHGGGITVVLSGDRELLGSRFFPLVPNRLFFPTEARDETLLMWPRLPPMDQVPGRLAAIGPVGTPAGSCGQTLAGPHRLDPRQMVPLPAGCSQPHPIRPLPRLLAPDSLEAARDKDFAPVGVWGDELQTAFAHLRPGSVFLILGAPGSGRTGFLRQLDRSMKDLLECRWVKDPSDLPGGPPDGLLLLVDDIDALAPTLQQQLSDLGARGARIAASAASGHQLTLRVPLTAAVRSRPLGALLRPSSPSDADLLGVRVDAGRWPPGRGLLIDGPVSVEIQAAFG